MCPLAFGRTEITERKGPMKSTTTKRKGVPTGLPKKTYWHLYSLQTLESDKLAKIVNKILKNEFVLIK